MSRYLKLCQFVPFCATENAQVNGHAGTCLAHGTNATYLTLRNKKRKKYIGNTRGVRAY